MTNYTPIFKILRLVRGYWISGAALLLALLILGKGVPAWAAPALAPLNQTVPQPTATKEAPPVPQATNTPRPHKNNNDDNNNNNPAPTNTPAPAQPTTAPQQPAPAGGLTGVVVADRLNVRQGPGTSFALVGKLASGETVSVLNRNAAGDWWHVCCISGTQTDGWVSAQFIQPNFDAAQANNLLSVAENAPAPAPATATAAPATATSASATEVVTPTATTQAATTQVTTNTVSAAQAVTSTVAAETPTTAEGLQLTMEQTPTLVWQGHVFEIHFTITNTTDASVTQVELRDELQEQLKFVSAEAGNGGKVVPQNGNASRYVVAIQWPTLAAGATVTATVKLQIAANASNGAVIDNLGVAGATDLASTTAGVSIGLPPAGAPDFQ